MLRFTGRSVSYSKGLKVPHHTGLKALCYKFRFMIRVIAIDTAYALIEEPERFA